MRVNVELTPPAGRTAACIAFRWSLIGAGAALAVGGAALDHQALRAVGFVLLLLGCTLSIRATTTVQSAALRAVRQQGYDAGFEDGHETARAELTRASAVGASVLPMDRTLQKLAE